MNLVIQTKILTRDTNFVVSIHTAAEITGLDEITKGDGTEKRMGPMKELYNILTFQDYDSN